MNIETASETELLYRQISEAADSAGYHLNPDAEFTKELISGLADNQRRYGYASCPCRLASGDKNNDIDIICPCDYRDADLDEFGACYCALYVSEAVVNKERELTSIPERRPAPEKRRAESVLPPRTLLSGLSHPIWRCRVCGYLCAREEPPEVCPICKARKERFERFV